MQSLKEELKLDRETIESLKRSLQNLCKDKEYSTTVTLDSGETFQLVVTSQYVDEDELSDEAFMQNAQYFADELDDEVAANKKHLLKKIDE